MKRLTAILLSIILAAGTMSVNAASATDGDQDGDVCENPWAELFTLPEEETTTVTDVTTTAATGGTTTVVPATTVSGKVGTPGKAVIKKVIRKKLSAKKLKLKIRKLSGADGYQAAVYKTKKKAKKNRKAVVKKVVTKRKVTLKSKKLKNKKKLFVRVRAYKLDASGNKVYGKWSKVKKVKVKK